MKKEKIIQIVLSDSGQIVALTSKGRILCQEQTDRESGFVRTGKWFCIQDPIEDKKLLIKN